MRITRSHATIYLVNLAIFLITATSATAQVLEFEPVDEYEEEFPDPDYGIISLPDSIACTAHKQLNDTIFFPAWTIYPVWDNLLVNPYQVDHVDKPDTTLIDLTGFVMPVKNYITSNFGWRRWRYHYGVDQKVQVGDSVVTAFDGMVRIARRGKAYGNYIVVRHHNGLETVYAHLSRILVEVHQEVKAGQLIGLGGNTGRSTGSHLHFEVRYLGQAINPHNLICYKNFVCQMDTLLLNKEHFHYLKEVRQVRYHVVRQGDTLSRIARRYGVSVKHLCQLNKIRTNSILRIGQRIRYT